MPVNSPAAKVWYGSLSELSDLSTQVDSECCGEISTDTTCSSAPKGTTVLSLVPLLLVASPTMVRGRAALRAILCALAMGTALHVDAAPQLPTTPHSITTTRTVSRPRKQIICDLETEAAAAMGDCCADGSGHRRQQAADCVLPSMCPSVQCADSFGRFLGLCGEQMRESWGPSDPQVSLFAAFYDDCSSRFGETLPSQVILPNDPNMQLIGRFMSLATSAVPGDGLPFAEQAGCADSYRAITTLTQCEAAKDILQPELRGVRSASTLYASETRAWPHGCFTSAGSVYFNAADGESCEDDPAGVLAALGVDCTRDVEQYGCSFDMSLLGMPPGTLSSSLCPLTCGICTATNSPPLYEWTDDHFALCELDIPAPPLYAIMAGCSGGYLVIQDLLQCQSAKALLEPDMGGVVEGGYGSEWANGCFFNQGIVYFGTYGASHTAYSSWNGQHQAICILGEEEGPIAEYEVMAGCADGYETIRDLSLCESAKNTLEPAMNGVQSGGFGDEWSQGCFFNGDTVYFTTTGTEHSSYNNWNSGHQALCILSGPEPAPEPEPMPAYEVMAGCHNGYAPILDLDLCAEAKTELEPRMSGPQDGGFGDEWPAGCFFNGDRVYFGTTGNLNAHTDAQSYRTNGGWSDTHKALCTWVGGDSNAPGTSSCNGGVDEHEDVCGVCGGDGSTCIPYERSPHSIAFDMPGCEIRLRLELGAPATVSVLLAQRNAGAPQNAFIVWIDGERKGPEYGVTAGASFTTASALDESVYAYRLDTEALQVGVHDLRIFKNTEPNWNGQASGPNYVTFSGFLVKPTEEGPAAVTRTGAALPTRKIEFLGDSITAGYCNECQAPSAGDNYNSAIDDFAESFGSSWPNQICESFGAQCHTAAWSGRGLIQNCCGFVGHLMPDVFGRTLGSDDSTQWDWSTWAPDVLIVNLGTNDGGAAVTPEYEAAYTQLVLDAFTHYGPGLQVLLVSSRAAPLLRCCRSILPTNPAY